MKKRTKLGASQAVAIRLPSEEGFVPISVTETLPKPATVEFVSDAPPPERPPPTGQHSCANRSPVDDELIDNFDRVKKTRWRKMEVDVDQQVPICKDYHDTGYCTFGSSCKFMHIRDDVLSSSQLDRKLALDAFKKSQEKSNVPLSIHQSDLCSICGKFFKEAVITACHHQFCSRCAIMRYQHDHSCAICGADTHGIFNSIS
jgi:RING finger protein 113A